MLGVSVRHIFSYTVLFLFVVFFCTNGLCNEIANQHLLVGDSQFPDFSKFQSIRTLSPEEFPIDDPNRRVIIVGDIHGMYQEFTTLLKKVSYRPLSDVLISVGDIVTRGPHNGSIRMLDYLSSHNITAVRGNHDQKVVEWRGWIIWIRSMPGGKRWLDGIHLQWREAEANGANLKTWLGREKKRVNNKWWKKIPRGWKLFSDHFNIAYAMSDSHYDYLRSLPLKIFVPSAHTYIVHAGLLPSDPAYADNNPRQPLAHIPKLPSKFETLSVNETHAVLRRLQELAVMVDVPQNNVPWNVLNMRSILGSKILKTHKGKAWSKSWNHEMSLCRGFHGEFHINAPHKGSLPCYPSTVIYGHAARRGLDVKRWSIGLDTGCVYRRRLTALLLSSETSGLVTSIHSNRASIPFGEGSHGQIVSVSCS